MLLRIETDMKNNGIIIDGEQGRVSVPFSKILNNPTSEDLNRMYLEGIKEKEMKENAN